MGTEVWEWNHPVLAIFVRGGEEMDIPEVVMVQYSTPSFGAWRLSPEKKVLGAERARRGMQYKWIYGELSSEALCVARI